MEVHEGMEVWVCVYECVMEWRYGCVCVSVWWNRGMAVCV